MKSYGFLPQMDRLQRAYRKHESTVHILNIAILSTSFFAVAELLGIPAFMNFFWKDYIFLAAFPIIFSIVLGIFAAFVIKRRKKTDFFSVLDSELSQKTKTAYDNKDSISIPMQRLANELSLKLAELKPANILDRKMIKKRFVLLIILCIITILIGQSQISADITPADFQSLTKIKDKALGSLEEKKTLEKSRQNTNNSIFGKPSLAVLNEDRIDLILDPGTGSGSYARNTKPIERAFQQSPAGEASIVPSELYIESMPPENKEIIKRYFTILSESKINI